MFFGRIKRLRSYVSSSLWVIPFIAIPLELILTRIAHVADTWLQWNLLGASLTGAQTIYQTIITATLSFVVFTFGSLLVAVQIASGQLTPRIIATTLLRDGVVKYTVAILVFTLLFCLSAQTRMSTEVHQLVVLVAGLLGLLCFAAFFFLIDYASRLLRPISILARVAHDGLAVIESVYPIVSRGPESAEQLSKRGAPDLIILHQGLSGIVLGLELNQLVAEAQRLGAVIELVPQVGDFISVDEPLFKIYGKLDHIDVDRLRQCIAFGSERTLEQDPTFALRIIVDIALKALSPAINDPTTAVLAIDQVHRLLRMVGNRHLQTEEVLDASGMLRLIVRTPNWDDFVHLAFSEIRSCGGGNLQIVRRVRAMIENLIQTLPSYRHAALREQLDLLEREGDRNFRYAAEKALARIPDAQGLGGSAGMTRVS